MEENVVLEEAGRIAVIRFNRPEKLNAMNLEMWGRLDKLVTSACDEYDAIVLTGSGRAFSAGDDIKAMLDLQSLEDAHNFFSVVAGAMEAIATCSKPVVAALNGIAAGGGAEMLLLTDYVIAAREAWISYPEILIGLLPPILLSLGPEIIGLKKTRQLALTGERLTAKEALKLGIVDEIVDKKELLDKAINKAKQLASAPTHATRTIKQLLYQRYQQILGEAVAELERLVIGEEAKKLMQLFLESRAKKKG